MIAELTTAPWTFSLAAGQHSPGSHSLSASASDAAGNTTDSQRVMITVAPDPSTSGGADGGNGGGNGATNTTATGGCAVALRTNADGSGWLILLWLAVLASVPALRA